MSTMLSAITAAVRPSFVRITGRINSRHLSSSAAATTTAVDSSSLKFPTRHSLKQPPPTCVDAVERKELTHQVLDSRPGSLFTYHLEQEGDHWEVADATIQKVEYLIQGYSSTVEGALAHDETGTKNTLSSVVDTTTSSNDDALEAIQKLVHRLTTEGDLYMKLRQEKKSQLVVEQQQQRAQDLSATDDVSSHSIHANFCPPGPTVNMYDTWLDTMALSSSLSSSTDVVPQQAAGILENVLKRFDQDGGVLHCVNPATVPTAFSFNGVLRSIANTNNSNEQVRDEALHYAFWTYDAFAHYHQARNAATFCYMLQIVTKFLPTSLSRGNIGLALFQHAKDAQVVDATVVKAMAQLHATSNSPEHDEWYQAHLGQGQEVEPKYRKYSKSLRYRSNQDTY